MVRIEIKGDVIPAARPRFSGRRVYQPKRNVEYRQQVQATARLAMKGAEPLKGEICAVVKVYRKFQRTARKFGDVDNFCKAIFDGLSAIVFCDDAQIVRCVVEKYTDKENPRCVVEVGEMAETNKS